MKRKLIVFVILIIILVGSGWAVFSIFKSSVQLDFTIDRWASFVPPEEAHAITSSTIEVGEGNSFGLFDGWVGMAETDKKPFKLLEIVDVDHIKVEFDEFLVIVGEPIGEPSGRNPIIISRDKTCFRTRTYDAGVDLCLGIIE